MAAQKTSNFDIYIGQSIGLAISVPSALLYFVECLTILRHWKEFNSSFYKLFMISAVNNLFMNFLPSFVYARLIRLGWINDFYLSAPSWAPNLLCFTMYYNYHCENIATIFTLIHRLTVIAFPMGFEKLWRYLLPLSAVCIFVGPLLFTYRLLIWPLSFSVNADMSVEISLNTTLLTNASDKPTVTNYLMMLLTSVGYLLVNIALNLAVYVLYKKTQAKFSLNNDKSSRLMVYAIAIFLSQLLLCLFWLFLTLQIIVQVFPESFNRYLANQYVWMNDIRTVAFPAWFLLWASTELNERIKRHFPWMPTFRTLPARSSEPRSVQAVVGVGKVGTNRPPVWSRSSNNSIVPIGQQQQQPLASGRSQRDSSPWTMSQN